MDEECYRLREIALSLAAEGLSIIPLTHPSMGVKHGKTPSIANWRDYCTRRATPQEVDSWFPVDGEPHNIGIVTGPISGVVVINLTYSEIPHACSVPGLPPPARKCFTPSGQHWYYGWDNSNALVTGQRIHNMEIIGEGGYVVAPGSKPQTTSEQYRLVVEGRKQWWDLKPIPPAIVQGAGGGREEHTPPSPPSPLPLEDGGLPPEIKSRLSARTLWTIKMIAGEIENTTGLWANRLEGAASDLSGFGVSQEDAKSLLTGTWGRWTDPNLDWILPKVYSRLHYPACLRWNHNTATIQEQTTALGDQESPQNPGVSSPALVLANVEYFEEQPSGKMVAVHRPLNRILQEVTRELKWPATAAGGSLFTLRLSERDWDRKSLVPREAIWWLEKSDDLFAWFHSVCGGVLWETGYARESIADPSPRSLPSKGEFYALLQRFPVAAYDSVEIVPHYPPIPKVLYLLPNIPPPKDPTLPLWRQWMSMFNPETEEDAALLAAACLTPLWGGPPGSRPAFLLTSKHGRGVGKTCSIEAIAHLYGGSTNPSHLEGGPKSLAKALVSPEGLLHRCVVWDNLKGHQDYAVVESMITARTLQGHRLYHGHASRPNYVTWLLSANKAEATTDLAQRCIPIEIGRPHHDVDFITQYQDFLEAHRLELLGEMMEILGPNTPVKWTLKDSQADRWQAWMRAILCKIEGGEATLPLIKRRRLAIDIDLDESDAVVDLIVNLIHVEDAVGKALRTGQFTFPTEKLHKLAREQGLTKTGCIGFGYWLNRKMSDGDLHHLSRCRVRSAKGSLVRGYRFQPGIEGMRRLVLARQSQQKEKKDDV